MKISTCFILLLFASLVDPCNGDWTESLTGYFSYTNAECDSSTTITGTAVMSYDDVDFTDTYGMEFDYSGSCLYYVGGSMDMLSYDISSDIFGEGYCTECNGMVGCSTDGTCDTFMTRSATTTSSSGYQSTWGSKKQLSSETLEELKAPAMGLQNKVATAVNYQEQSVSSTPVEDPRYYVLGGAIGSVSLLGLVAILERLRQRRVEQAQREQQIVELSAGVSLGDYAMA